MKMKEVKEYEIYTDASFDYNAKVGAYAFIIKHNDKIEKVIAKKANSKTQTSTDCEIFAVFQAITYILNNLLNDYKLQKFLIRTDCKSVIDFFIKENNSVETFIENPEMVIMMKKVYKKLAKKLNRKGCSLKLRWMPRKMNKIAHQQTSLIFKGLKNNENYMKKPKDMIAFDKKYFIEFLQNFDDRERKVIGYLLNIMNEKNVILKTQKEIAQELGMSIKHVHVGIKKLMKWNILIKVKNGEYSLMI